MIIPGIDRQVRWSITFNYQNLNDYNDGAMTDNMSLEIAKGVYGTLGVHGDNFVKFNRSSYASKRDPHGFIPAAVESKYLSDFFFGAQMLTDRLNTDPKGYSRRFTQIHADTRG